MKNIKFVGMKVSLMILCVGLLAFNISIHSETDNVKNRVFNLHFVELVSFAGNECSATCADGTSTSVDCGQDECRAKTNYGSWCIDDNGQRTDEDLC